MTDFADLLIVTSNSYVPTELYRKLSGIPIQTLGFEPMEESTYLDLLLDLKK